MWTSENSRFHLHIGVLERTIGESASSRYQTEREKNESACLSKDILSPFGLGLRGILFKRISVVGDLVILYAYYWTCRTVVLFRYIIAHSFEPSE